MYIIVMIYSSISLVVVLLILRQTFDPTVLQTKAASQARRSSQQPLNSPHTPGSDFTTQKIISPGAMSPSSGTDRGSTFRSAQEYELANARSSAAPTAGFASQSGGVYASTAPTAEGPEGIESWGGSSVGHGHQQNLQQHEWRVNGSGRRPVPEL